MTRAPSGIATVPEPNGQMPPIARNSVDLPEPEGPVTSTRSPDAKARSSAPTSGIPVGRCTSSASSASRGFLPAETRRMTGGVTAAAAPTAIDLSKPDKRSITARHSANSR